MLVEELLGFRMRKEHSAVDWSRRPLPEPWLLYAALDVETARRAARRARRPARGGRQAEWARAGVRAPGPRLDPAPAVEPWRRTSGIHRVRGRRGLALVRAMWELRDELAQRPRRHVQPDPARLGHRRGRRRPHRARATPWPRPGLRDPRRSALCQGVRGRDQRGAARCPTPSSRRCRRRTTARRRRARGPTSTRPRPLGCSAAPRGHRGPRRRARPAAGEPALPRRRTPAGLGPPDPLSVETVTAFLTERRRAPLAGRPHRRCPHLLPTRLAGLRGDRACRAAPVSTWPSSAGAAGGWRMLLRRMAGVHRRERQGLWTHQARALATSAMATSRRTPASLTSEHLPHAGSTSRARRNAGVRCPAAPETGKPCRDSHIRSVAEASPVRFASSPIGSMRLGASDGTGFVHRRLAVMRVTLAC